MAEMRAQMKALAEQGKPPSSSTAAAPAPSGTSPPSATASTPPPSSTAPTPPAVDLAARVDKLEQSAAKAPPRESDTTLFSYGEIAYSRPHDANDTQADLVRAVIGFGHRFDFKRQQVRDVRMTAHLPDGKPIELKMPFTADGLARISLGKKQ